MALSKTQNRRLAGILGVMFKEDLPTNVVRELKEGGFVNEDDASVSLTDKGIDEKNRLCTLAGLNIKYSSERKDECT